MARISDEGQSQLLTKYALGVAVLVVAGIAASVYPVELGLARVDMRTTRAVVALAEVDGTLDGTADGTGEGTADFVEFSTALRVAMTARDALPARNVADTRMVHIVGNALDCLAALREGWQLERDGNWDPDIHGQRSYWEGLHPAIELEGDGAVDPDALRGQLRSQARGYTRDALRMVER